MKLPAALLFLTVTLTAEAVPMAYPKNPDPRITPGSLCEHPDSYRYPEQIPYCERAVNSYTKEIIFSNYKRLGFRLNADRMMFKVDHFIPLCAGGSNNDDNLWPQHVSVGTITDPIEGIGCEKLGLAKITQHELIDLVKKAKLNLEEAPGILKYLKTLK